MAAGYTVVWFLFKRAPYDIGRFYRPDGTWTGYYVDILEPVYWDGSDPDSLRPIVDLSLDVWIAPDGSTLILDEDEFDDAVRRGFLTAEQARHARYVLDRVLTWTAHGHFPPETVRRFRLDAGGNRRSEGMVRKNPTR